MKNDLGFHDPSPLDMLNESLKSEFDLSFASQRSTSSLNSSLHITHDSFGGSGVGGGGNSFSESHLGQPHPQFQLTHQQQISNAQCLVTPSTPTTLNMMTPSSDRSTITDSPPDTKRKYDIAVTPQKDRDHKRQKPVESLDYSTDELLIRQAMFSHQQNCQQQIQQDPVNDVDFHSMQSTPFQPQNIRAEFRYQLTSEPKDWHMDQEVPNNSNSNSSNNVNTANSHPIWSGFMDMDHLPE